jgi:hypothetical protein
MTDEAICRRQQFGQKTGFGETQKVAAIQSLTRRAWGRDPSGCSGACLDPGFPCENLLIDKHSATAESSWTALPVSDLDQPALAGEDFGG